MIPTLLQTAKSCGKNVNGTARYEEMWGCGNWFDASVMPFLDLFGPIFIVLVGLWLGGILFVYHDGMGMPTVVIILVGAMLIPFLPAQAQTAALMLIIIGVGLALYNAWMSSGGRR